MSSCCGRFHVVTFWGVMSAFVLFPLVHKGQSYLVMYDPLGEHWGNKPPSKGADGGSLDTRKPTMNPSRNPSPSRRKPSSCPYSGGLDSCYSRDSAVPPASSRSLCKRCPVRLLFISSTVPHTRYLLYVSPLLPPPSAPPVLSSVKRLILFIGNKYRHLIETIVNRFHFLFSFSVYGSLLSVCLYVFLSACLFLSLYRFSSMWLIHSDPRIAGNGKRAVR